MPTLTRAYGLGFLIPVTHNMMITRSLCLHPDPRKTGAQPEGSYQNQNHEADPEGDGNGGSRKAKKRGGGCKSGMLKRSTKRKTTIRERSHRGFTFRGMLGGSCCIAGRKTSPESDILKSSMLEVRMSREFIGMEGTEEIIITRGRPASHKIICNLNLSRADADREETVTARAGGWKRAGANPQRREKDSAPVERGIMRGNGKNFLGTADYGSGSGSGGEGIFVTFFQKDRWVYGAAADWVLKFFFRREEGTALDEKTTYPFINTSVVLVTYLVILFLQ